MEQDILCETQELILKFKENKIIEDELYLQLKTLEQILLATEDKAFAFIKPFIKNLFVLSKQKLSYDNNKKILDNAKLEIDSIIKQFEERKIKDDFYYELKMLKTALNTSPFCNCTINTSFVLLTKEIIEDAQKKLNKITTEEIV